MSDSKYQKLADKLDKDFVKEAISKNDDQIRDFIVTISQQIEGVQEQKKQDPTRKQLGMDLKTLNDGYRDVINPMKLKLQFMLSVLQERGKI